MPLPTSAATSSGEIGSPALIRALQAIMCKSSSSSRAAGACLLRAVATPTRAQLGGLQLLNMAG